MPAPSPAAIVDDPPPLNSTEFPYRVDALPARWLQAFGGLFALTIPDAPAPPPNPHRFER